MTAPKKDPPSKPTRKMAPPAGSKPAPAAAAPAPAAPTPAAAPAPAPPPADPFSTDDPLDAVAPGSPVARGDDEFDALGFDTSFGTSPGGFGASPEPGGFGAPVGDNDETPPAGVFAGEEVQVLSAHSIGKALAEARGDDNDHALPDLTLLQQGLVGIDIGASVAVVTRFTTDGQHEVVPNEHDDLSTPMQLFYDEDGERLVGREARAMAPSAPGRAIVDLKEVIADPFFRLKTGDGEIDSQTIISQLLERLLADVERHAGEKATHIALSAPAWFAEPQLEVLRNAVTRTGLTLVGITDEALAAAVPYSLRLPDLNPRVAIVFDLGHAALGVGVVRCAGGDITVLAKDSKRDLGSSRWDLLIAQEAARKFKQAHDVDPMADTGARLDLKLRAEDAKRELSRRPQCTIAVSAKGKTFKVGFTKQGFEDAARPLLEKSLAFAREVRDKAGFTSWSAIDALIMTGGGSRTPIVKKALHQEIGREPEKGIAIEEGVAVGALYWGIGERHRQATKH